MWMMNPRTVALAKIVSTIPPHWVSDTGVPKRRIREEFAVAVDIAKAEKLSDQFILDLTNITTGTDPRGGTFRQQAAAIANHAAIQLARSVLSDEKED